jgi:hypothetical protein
MDILARLCCLIGQHQWIYDHPNCNRNRDCKSCGRWESYTLVDCGRRKIWLKRKPSPKPTWENSVECRQNSLTNVKEHQPQIAGAREQN